MLKSTAMISRPFTNLEDMDVKVLFLNLMGKDTDSAKPLLGAPSKLA